MKKLLITLSAIVIVVVLWFGISPKNEENSPSSFPSMSLGLKGPAKVLAQSGSTFPSSEAGLAAYIRVTPLDVVKAAKAFDAFYQLGGNWVIGVVKIPIFPSWDGHTTKTADIRVYIDSQGWIVSYFPKDVPLATMMVWAGVDASNPQLNSITTALEEAIKNVLHSAGVDYTPIISQIGYYDFQYPAANGVTMAAKVGNLGPISLYFSIAQGAMCWPESISYITSPTSSGIIINATDSNNGTHFSYSGADYNTPFDSPSAITAGLGYKYSIQTPSGGGGIAVVVIYTTP